MLKYFIMNANNSSSNSLPTLNSSEHIIKKRRFNASNVIIILRHTINKSNIENK